MANLLVDNETYDMPADFYNTLLGIEVTILGIIAAGIFVFIQILHSNFSYNDVTLTLRRISLVVYSILSSVLILITGLGSLHFAMTPHDLIHRWNLNTDLFFQNDVTLLSIFVGLLFSVVIGMYVIFESIKLLNPAFLLQKHLNNASNESIKKFLYHKYGVPEPIQPISIFYTLQGVDETEEEKVARDAEVAEKQRKYEEESRKSEHLRQASENALDVFEGFENILVRSISLGDRGVVKKGLGHYESTIKEVISGADASFPIQHLATYVSDNLTIALEACRKHQTLSLTPQIVRASRNIVMAFIDHSPREANEILKVWKKQADTALEYSDRLLFKEIVNSYKIVADATFDQGKDSKDDSDILENVFRHLGWLAERLLSKKGIEEKPLMYDEDYEDEFGVIYNTLFHFEHKYNYDKPNSYPLIFFDAIHVLFNSLLEVYKQSQDERLPTLNKRGDIKDWLFSCAYVYSSFATKALSEGNGDGFALAGTRLRQLYRTAQTAREEELLRNVLELIVRFAIQAATNPEKLEGDSFGTRTVVGDSEKIILGSPHKDTVRSAVFENYIKIDEGEHDKKYTYIKTLGVKMGTSFGLMFDPTTGEDFSPDDPRRR